MPSLKEKYIAPNFLHGKFVVAKRNKVWTLDDTTIRIGDGSQRLRVLHITDLATKCILTTLVTLKDFNSAHIKRAVMRQIRIANIQEFDELDKRLILHTDRDTHFTSRTWWSLANELPKSITLSMSASGTPIENSPSERLNGTIKHLNVPDFKKKYGYSSISEILLQTDANSQDINFYRKIIKDFTDYYNTKHIHQEIRTNPATQEQYHIEGEPKLPEPNVLAVRNNVTSPNADRELVLGYRKALEALYKESKQISDDPNNTAAEKRISRLVQEVIERETKKLAILNQAQFTSLHELIEDIHIKLDDIASKREKRSKQKMSYPLRDPIAHEVYEALMEYFPKGTSKQQIVHLAQMRIIVVVLYTTGARVNEITDLTFEDFRKVPTTQQLHLHQSKTESYRIAYFGPLIVKEYDKIKDDVEFLFNECGFKVLGATLKNTEKSMDPRSWIRKTNQFLRTVKKELGLDLILKSHSFRVGFISNMLTKTDIVQTARIIGHKGINTTARYTRYASNNVQTRALIDDALGLGNVTIDEKKEN